MQSRIHTSSLATDRLWLRVQTYGGFQRTNAASPECLILSSRECVNKKPGPLKNLIHCEDLHKHPFHSWHAERDFGSPNIIAVVSLHELLIPFQTPDWPLWLGPCRLFALAALDSCSISWTEVLAFYLFIFVRKGQSVSWLFLWSWELRLR